MCGIVGFLDKTGRLGKPTAGRIVLTMLEALACRGPDSAGVALIGPERAGRGRCLVRPHRCGRPNARSSGSPHWATSFRMPTGSSARARAIRCASVSGRRRGDGRRPRASPRRPPRRPGGLEPGRGSTWSSESGRPPGSNRPMALDLERPGGHRPHPDVDREPDRSEPLPAVLGARRARPGDGPQRPRDQLPPTSPPLRAAGSTFYTDNDSEVIGVYLRERLERAAACPRRWPTRSRP